MNAEDVARFVSQINHADTEALRDALADLCEVVAGLESRMLDTTETPAKVTPCNQ